MLTIKNAVHAFLVASLFAFACASNAPRDVAGASQSYEEPSGLPAESKTIIVAAAQTDAAIIFKGSIGAAAFEMTVRRAGENLSGSYFYRKSGSANRLSLLGKIAADGKFTLQETDADGRQTGEFKGVWQEDANEPGISIEGEWTKTGAEKGAHFFAAEEMISLTGGWRIIDKKLSSPVKAIKLEADAEYPQLTGGAANAASFNRIVRARVEKVVADFKRLMIKETTAEDLKRLSVASGYYIDIGYTVQYADNDLISLLFSEDTFSGGAHPNHNFFALNFDLKNEREIKLAELFKPAAKYLETVSAYSIKDLQSRTSPDSGENAGLAQDIWLDGALPKADNYKSWNITKKGLMFTFDPYQVGSYVDGPQFVIVPYARLLTDLKPNGAAAKFVK